MRSRKRSVRRVGLKIVVCSGLLWIAVPAAAQQGAGSPALPESRNVGCPEGPNAIDMARILEAHGLSGTDDVRLLDFTFHVRTPDGEVVRSWRWDTVRNEVTLTTSAEDGSPHMLAFSSPPPDDAGEEIVQADRWFINDRYWLLFPLQLAWEDGVVVTVECEPQPLPLERGEGPRFTATYTGPGGYTPGDAYDFFPEPSGRIAQWVYRRGNAEDPTITVTFDDYTEVGPLTLSLRRSAADGEPRVWFTDMAVTTGELRYRVVTDGEE